MLFYFTLNFLRWIIAETDFLLHNLEKTTRDNQGKTEFMKIVKL